MNNYCGQHIYLPFLGVLCKARKHRESHPASKEREVIIKCGDRVLNRLSRKERKEGKNGANEALMRRKVRRGILIIISFFDKVNLRERVEGIGGGPQLSSPRLMPCINDERI